MLLDAGADPRAVTRERGRDARAEEGGGHDALFFAARYGRAENVAFWLEVRVARSMIDFPSLLLVGRLLVGRSTPAGSRLVAFSPVLARRHVTAPAAWETLGGRPSHHEHDAPSLTVGASSHSLSRRFGARERFPRLEVDARAERSSGARALGVALRSAHGGHLLNGAAGTASPKVRRWWDGGRVVALFHPRAPPFSCAAARGRPLLLRSGSWPRFRQRRSGAWARFRQRRRFFRELLPLSSGLRVAASSSSCPHHRRDHIAIATRATALLRCSPPPRRRTSSRASSAPARARATRPTPG